MSNMYEPTGDWEKPWNEDDESEGSVFDPGENSVAGLNNSLPLSATAAPDLHG